MLLRFTAHFPPRACAQDQTRSGNYGCRSCFPNWTKAFLDQAAPVLAGVTFHHYPGHSQGATPAHLDNCDILSNALLQKTHNIASKWQALVGHYRGANQGVCVWKGKEGGGEGEDKQ